MSIKEDLSKKEFQFKKKYGQNFIFETNLLEAIVSDACVTKDDIVLEIGTGAGTLTKAIARKAKKVISFEIDNTLKEYLETSINEDNIEIIYKDIMKVSDEEIINILKTNKYKVIANLPYYITTPIILKFLESSNPPSLISVMVQKEVAERIVSKPKDSSYGGITAIIELYGEANIERIVRRELFYPQPDVDSAILSIRYKPLLKDEKEIDKVKSLIKAGFAKRRKMLSNNISTGLNIPKSAANIALQNIGFSDKVRGEELSANDYIKLALELKL